MKKDFKTDTTKKLVRRMKTPPRGFFIANENNIRFCYLTPREENEYKLYAKSGLVTRKPNYITIPYIDFDMLSAAAQMLKDAKLIYDYKACKATDSCFYIKLYRKIAKEHREVNGLTYWVNEVVEIQWSDLKLTESDVKMFVAHFEYNRVAKIIKLFPINSKTKTAA
jgi:hypothetical protein